MHELAVAISATGCRVTMRGDVDIAELELLCSAADAAMPELPKEAQRPGRGDIVFMPEGFSDPLHFAYIALSGARQILVLLAPPGLFGWPFVEGWALQPALNVSIESVARPEHFQAMAAMGFELWTPAPALADCVEASGVPCTFTGAGRPVAYPPPLPKRWDVVTLANNRWAELAREVAARLEPEVSHHEIAAGSNEDILRQLGQARILIHPLRIEGDSRIGQEARAMGAVPVVLNTNPFSVGLNETGGAVALSTLVEMPAAVRSLLGDPERLRQLRERGMQAARAEVDWEIYVRRVDAALSALSVEDPGREARAAIGDRLMEKEDAVVGEARTTEEDLNKELDDIRAKLSRTRAERDELGSALEEERELVRSIRTTRTWRLATRYWRARARVRHLLARHPTRRGGE
jgi:hypothetical protein